MTATVALSLALWLGGCSPEASEPVKTVDAGSTVDTSPAPDVINGSEDTSDDASSGVDAGACQGAWAGPGGGFERICAEQWDETAVRKVLHIFAFGSSARDDQVKAWADMGPQAAIKEIITFEPFHPKLSPPDQGQDAIAAPADGTLEGMRAFWASADKNNPVAASYRKHFELPGRADRLWLLAARAGGANPVRQRIGLFETNYHLSVNQSAGVSALQIYRYYDDIMKGLAADKPYGEVLAEASQAAAVATQYNHKKNRYINAKFEGNEDFAREFHQLFFGILGVADPEYHEMTSIRNTAKALTDMVVKKVEIKTGKYDVADVIFGTEYHYPGDLEILGSQISGKTAKEKLDALAKVAIAHPESLANLPVIIISHLADDRLTDAKVKVIRAAWAAQKKKSLLAFLRDYATSTLFHDKTRIKYWTSAERLLIAANRLSLQRATAYRNHFNPESQLFVEGVRVFRPTHNVFGGQTSLEAMGSAEVFRLAYNLSVAKYSYHGRTRQLDSDKAIVWEQRWTRAIPADKEGNYRLEAVAEWLWQHLVADGLKNFGPLERAHVYALIGAGKDFASFVDSQAPLAVFSSDDITKSKDIIELIEDMKIAKLDLASDDDAKRHIANTRMALAVNFILATPYAFAQEGK